MRVARLEGGLERQEGRRSQERQGLSRILEREALQDGGARIQVRVNRIHVPLRLEVDRLEPHLDDAPVAATDVVDGDPADGEVGRLEPKIDRRRRGQVPDHVVVPELDHPEGVRGAVARVPSRGGLVVARRHGPSDGPGRGQNRGQPVHRPQVGVVKVAPPAHHEGVPRRVLPEEARLRDRGDDAERGGGVDGERGGRVQQQQATRQLHVSGEVLHPHDARVGSVSRERGGVPLVHYGAARVLYRRAVYHPGGVLDQRRAVGGGDGGGDEPVDGEGVLLYPRGGVRPTPPADDDLRAPGRDRGGPEVGPQVEHGLVIGAVARGERAVGRREEVEDKGGEAYRGHAQVVGAGGGVVVQVEDVKVTTSSDICFYCKTVNKLFIH